ncbi:MAG TPA: ABC transporter ATP-binding protein [Pirellula sp.]|nr:ABC transporter ATP-binding protein [Pirellula sp.]
MINIVEVNQLTKRYGNFSALNECCLAVPEGSIFGLLGPNGAGKTTLIRCLMGYLRPTSGVAKADGFDCEYQSLQVRERVCYLPAETKLFRMMKGRDCVDFFSKIHPRGSKQLALSIAERLELDIGRRVGFMSTGMRQKLAIACVMSCQCRLMILDEPTANLDPTVRAEVLKLVRETNQRGTTVAFCSHVLSEIEEICDRAAILKCGQVVRSVDLREVRFVHRVRATLPDCGTTIMIPDPVRTISREAGRIVLEMDGLLDNHLRWLSDSGLQSVQIDSIGLRSIYDSVHPRIPILKVLKVAK